MTQPLTSATTTTTSTGTLNQYNHHHADSTTPTSEFPSGTQFEVYVSNDTFKFNAAHFVAYENYRERLHGHNYRVGVRLIGERRRRQQPPQPPLRHLYQQQQQQQHTGILGPDGYLIDFTNVKKVTKHVCQQLNEHFICPMYSNVLNITTITMDDERHSSVATSTTGAATGTPDPATNVNVNINASAPNTPQEYIRIECTMDQTQFLFPKQDCVLLPIVHATAEELAIYIYCEIINQLQASYLIQRNIHCMEITVAEAIGQEAVFRHPIPTNTCRTTDDTPHADTNIQDGPTTTTASNTASSLPLHLDVRPFIMTGNIVPMPCLAFASVPADEGSNVVRNIISSGSNSFNNNSICGGSGGEISDSRCCSECNARCGNTSTGSSTSLESFSQQLQQIADAINDGTVLQRNDNTEDPRPVTVNDLQQLIHKAHQQ
jgi:dihydroneopterin triphosphate aldolase (PTPS-III) / 6-pyruvoyltetrahydropterin synthase